jgi:hypothetical protein
MPASPAPHTAEDVDATSVPDATPAQAKETSKPRDVTPARARDLRIDCVPSGGIVLGGHAATKIVFPQLVIVDEAHIFRYARLRPPVSVRVRRGPSRQRRSSSSSRRTPARGEPDPEPARLAAGRSTDRPHRLADLLRREVAA